MSRTTGLLEVLEEKRRLNGQRPSLVELVRHLVEDREEDHESAQLRDLWNRVGSRGQPTLGDVMLLEDLLARAYAAAGLEVGYRLGFTEAVHALEEGPLDDTTRRVAETICEVVHQADLERRDQLLAVIAAVKELVFFQHGHEPDA